MKEDGGGLGTTKEYLIPTPTVEPFGSELLKIYQSLLLLYLGILHFNCLVLQTPFLTFT